MEFSVDREEFSLKVFPGISSTVSWKPEFLPKILPRFLTKLLSWKLFRFFFPTTPPRMSTAVSEVSPNLYW